MYLYTTIVNPIVLVVVASDILDVGVDVLIYYYSELNRVSYLLYPTSVIRKYTILIGENTKSLCAPLSRSKLITLVDPL